MTDLRYIIQRLAKSEALSVLGKGCKLTEDGYYWPHYKNDNEITIVTNNVSYWKNKDCYVLWVANNKIVYLKPWQLVAIHNCNLKINAYAVKLSRNYFKAYKTYTNLDLTFKNEDTFDTLLECAKTQDKDNTTWELGHFKKRRY